MSLIFWLSISIEPFFKWKNLGIKFKNVVFPEPLTPTRPTFVPPSIFAERFFKAWVPSG